MTLIEKLMTPPCDYKAAYLCSWVGENGWKEGETHQETLAVDPCRCSDPALTPSKTSNHTRSIQAIPAKFLILLIRQSGGNETLPSIYLLHLLVEERTAGIVGMTKSFSNLGFITLSTMPYNNDKWTRKCNGLLRLKLTRLMMHQVPRLYQGYITISEINILARKVSFKQF